MQNKRGRKLREQIRYLIYFNLRDARSKNCQRVYKTRQNKKRSHKKKLEFSGIQDVKSKYKQSWIKHLERMDNTRLPKHALNYKPRGRRDRGAPGKDDKASMPEEFKRPNPWRQMIMMMMFNIIRK